MSEYADKLWTEASNMRLKAENDRLRELVADMGKAFIHGNCYRWCEFKETCDSKPINCKWMVLHYYFKDGE